MSINSENIVDDFLKKISESLPVGERDAYNAWKKEQEEKAARASEDRRTAVFERQRNKKAADVAYGLSNFFRNPNIRSDDHHVFGDFDGDGDGWLAMIDDNKDIYFYTGFFDLFKKYNINCKLIDKHTSTMEINLYGKREKIGPLYGKLKKLGLNVVREVGQITNAQGYVTNHLSVTFSPEEFIEAAKKGLSIRDFEMAQWQ